MGRSARRVSKKDFRGQIGEAVQWAKVDIWDKAGFIPTNLHVTLCPHFFHGPKDHESTGVHSIVLLAFTFCPFMTKTARLRANVSLCLERRKKQS
jgi:hypothetical protein